MFPLPKFCPANDGGYWHRGGGGRVAMERGHDAKVLQAPKPSGGAVFCRPPFAVGEKQWTS